MTLFLNLKKCSKAKGVVPFLLLISLPGWTAETAALAPSEIKKVIQSELEAQHSPSFETLLPSWEKRFGSKALHPLLQIASGKKYSDSQRYIALMSATKLGGSETLPWLLPLLRDSSWMVRSGALRALCILKQQESGEAVLPLIHDPALVVRAEAVDAIRLLRPKGASEALISAINNKDNYHGNKAQWVPQKALLALAELRVKEAIPHLQNLVNDPTHQNDTEFLQQARRTLEVIEK